MALYYAITVPLPDKIPEQTKLADVHLGIGNIDNYHQMMSDL